MIPKIRPLLAIILIILIVCILTSCALVKGPEDSEDVTTFEGEYPTATIVVKDKGEMVVELYPDKAPNTVKNFISLAENGYYDGQIFHRIVYGFMIQGGDPTGTGMGGPGYSIKGEFAENGFKQNDLEHERGVISMARSQDMDSAGSQFFIMHQDNSGLDGKYAAFGKVIEGYETLDAVAKVATEMNGGGEQSTPVNQQIIESITIQQNDWTFEEPEIIE